MLSEPRLIEDMSNAETIELNLEGIQRRICKIRELLPAIESLVTECRTRAEVVDVLMADGVLLTTDDEKNRIDDDQC